MKILPTAMRLAKWMAYLGLWSARRPCDRKRRRRTRPVTTMNAEISRVADSWEPQATGKMSQAYVKMETGCP